MSDIKARLIEQGLIPWDKLFIIFAGLMDFFREKNDICVFLEREMEGGRLCNELISFWQALIAWKERRPISTDSALVYQLFAYFSWSISDRREFIKQGALMEAEIESDPMRVIFKNANKLLEMHNGVNWACAHYFRNQIMINRCFGRIANPPPKLQSAYEALDHWYSRKNCGLSWEPRYDQAILRQAVAAIEAIKNGKTAWEPTQPQDYYLAEVLGGIDNVSESWPKAQFCRFIEFCKEADF